MNRIFMTLLLLLPFGLLAQQDKDFDYQSEIADHTIDTMDWSAATVVDLGETKFFALNLRNDLERKYFVWLETRVNDVYPFLEKAVTEYYAVKDSARHFPNEAQRRKFIKERYNQLAQQYEDQLKNLSTSRGQILSKLIHRETQKNTYDIIREMRGGTSAFLWNAAGGAFNIDLKKGFDPEATREDLMIEVIIQRGIANGKFERIVERENRLQKISPILRAFGR